ncbi:unnamed protein product [Auanema sp. JU1783]|nr:unnamed protein product [Auanema sp. JU1783]
MPLAEELERLSGEKSVKKEINGWCSTNSRCHTRQTRLVSKDGKPLYDNIQIPSRIRRAAKNWFHLTIEYKWRTILTVFAGGFFLSWILFALIYYAITHYHRLYDTTDHYRPCIVNVDNMATALLFSLESQATIGYGHRYMTDLCPMAYTTLCIQVIAGNFLQTLLGGLVIAKILRPTKRRQEMRFSRMAVIGHLSENDRRPALQVRLADIQEKLFLAESHVRMFIVNSRINKRGDRELVGMRDINVGYDSGWDRVLLLWPIVVRHVIDENSPLYGMTRESLQEADFEIIMTVEGIVEATGMTFQARTSFLPSEILWGHRFKTMVTLNEKLGKYEVNYNLFDQTDRIPDFEMIDIEEGDENDNFTGPASGFL